MMEQPPLGLAVGRRRLKGNRLAEIYAARIDAQPRAQEFGQANVGRRRGEQRARYRDAAVLALEVVQRALDFHYDALERAAVVRGVRVAELVQPEIQAAREIE